MKELAIKIGLGIAILILSFMLFQSIRKPLAFNRERDQRLEAAIDRLSDIRRAQLAFKEIHGYFTGSFDSLIHFISMDSFIVQSKTGLFDPNELFEKEAIERGLVKVSENHISVLDSLFDQGYKVDSIRYVPIANDNEFIMDAGIVTTASNVKVHVFEVYVLFETLFADLDPQLTANFISERERISGFPGLKIGSLFEISNHTGNWE